MLPRNTIRSRIDDDHLPRNETRILIFQLGNLALSRRRSKVGAPGDARPVQIVSCILTASPDPRFCHDFAHASSKWPGNVRSLVLPTLTSLHSYKFQSDTWFQHRVFYPNTNHGEPAEIIYHPPNEIWFGNRVKPIVTRPDKISFPPVAHSVSLSTFNGSIRTDRSQHSRCLLFTRKRFARARTCSGSSPG